MKIENHTRECLSEGNENNCPVCAPINEKFKNAGLRKSKVWSKGENIELYQSVETFGPGTYNHPKGGVFIERDLNRIQYWGLIK